MVRIVIPKNVKFLMLTDFTYLFNEKYYLFYKTNMLFFNKNLNVMRILYLNLYKKNKICIFLFSWNTYFFTKLSFLGKGFKITKINNYFFFNFNHTHIELLVNKTTIIKKIQKSKLLIYSNNFKLLQIANYKILKIKLLNFYTKRGIRNAKQKLYFKKYNLYS